jgi:hypothetical protein
MLENTLSPPTVELFALVQPAPPAPIVTVFADVPTDKPVVVR